MLFETNQEETKKVKECLEDIYPIIIKHGHSIAVSAFYHLICTFIATSSNPKKMTNEVIYGLRCIPKDMMKDIERRKKEEENL
jgi:hypothetical protein